MALMYYVCYGDAREFVEGQGVGCAGELDALEVIVKKLSRKFGDLSHLKSNVTRAYNLWTQTSFEEDAFVAKLEEAARITLEAVSKSQVKDESKRMAYFFSVLEERLGWKNDHRRYVEGRYAEFVQH